MKPLTISDTFVSSSDSEAPKSSQMCFRPDTVRLWRLSVASDLSFDRFNFTCNTQYRDQVLRCA